MLSMDKLRPLLTAKLLAGSISALGVAGTFGATPTQTCGTITQYIPATPLTTGLLTIGGQTFTLGSGSTSTGNLSVGSNSCVTTTQDSQSQVTSLAATGNSHTTATYCGTVTSFVAPPANSPGQIGIGGQTFNLTQGGTVTGSVTPGQNACATMTFNGLGSADSTRLAQTSAPQVGGSVNLNSAGTTSGSTSSAAAASQSTNPSASGSVRINQPGRSNAVLGESLTNGAPGSGSGGSAAGPQAAQQGGSGVGPIPDTATLAQVLGLTARTAVPVGVLGLGLLAFAGVAMGTVKIHVEHILAKLGAAGAPRPPCEPSRWGWSRPGRPCLPPSANPSPAGARPAPGPTSARCDARLS